LASVPGKDQLRGVVIGLILRDGCFAAHSR
jgi:hypothetical protein